MQRLVEQLCTRVVMMLPGPTKLKSMSAETKGPLPREQLPFQMIDHDIYDDGDINIIYKFYSFRSLPKGSLANYFMLK